MTTTVYNIVWADDEIDDIISGPGFTTLLNNSGLNLIGTATSAVELKNLLKELEGQVDAVIIDANFSKISSSTNEHDFTGLQYCADNIIEIYEDKMPFFLCTRRGSEELIRECEKGDWLKYFRDHKDQWFDKGKVKSILYAAIKKKVEEFNTPESQIRRRYPNEFVAARLIDGAEALILKGLLFEYNEESKTIDAQDLFNPLRKIVEKIMDSLKDEKLIPPIPSTQANGFCKFLSGEHPIFKLEEKDFMPAPLVCSLKFFLDITQDGSHSNKELKLAVDKYVAENKNINLFRTVLYIAMDLLLWHKRTIEKDFEYEIWSWNKPIIGEGEIQYDEERKFDRTFEHYYVGKFELQRIEKVEFGAYAYIIKSGPNKHPYRNDHAGIYLSDFVSAEDFYII